MWETNDVYRSRYFRKVTHKAVKYLGNKSADNILSKTLAMQTNADNDIIEKQQPVQERIFPAEMREEILSKLRTVLL